MFLNDNHEMASYAAESVLPYVTKMGPLALYAPEWLGAILRGNGLEEKALEAEQQELKPFDIYRIRKMDAGKGIEFEDTKGENFYVTDEGLKNPSVKFYKSKTALGAFVKYQDSWHLNATINWSQGGEELFEFTKSEVERHRRQTDFDYDKLMSASDGSPFFYFENYQKMKDYLSKEGGMSMEMLTGFEKPGENERIIAVVSSRDNVGFHYGDGVEFCLKDSRNPYYDEKIAKRESLTFALKLSGSALKYAMDHGMLPHAQLKSIYGAERGRALFRENYDFFARATMREEYE